MPVTVNIATHGANKWSQSKAETELELLKIAYPAQVHKCDRIIEGSFSKSALRDAHVTASSNGFILAVRDAYSDHHHLTIRPEDVWLAILTQVSFYINAHAERLRETFVSHAGQEEFIVLAGDSYGEKAQLMTEEMQKKLRDPDLRTWVLPDLSTTTDIDRIAASIVFMGTMQKFFNYEFGFICGIPSVTLLRKRANWQDLRRRIDKINA